ncbi:hypothetical protein ON010_g288 [Phytophthora cinnamomi]|nr:hypothetical protein ON010_g288 [Phytophthora cinnamomi]
MANKRIDKIANFDAFVNLEVLWINGNQVQELDGLDGCFRIKQLFAQNNCIRSLEGSSLPHFKFLRELRLYDNKLKDLQGTLDVLSRLSHLRDLDLFGNPVVEEENYRLQVIRAIPSLDVLDRHVITDEERAKAARWQIHGVDDGDIHANQHGPKKGRNKQSGTVAGAPPQALSGTKQAHEAAEREHEELKRTQQQALSATSTSRRSGNNNKADEIPSLSDWEVTELKKYFQSLEAAKNSGITQESLGQVRRYLRTRGYAVSYNGIQPEGKQSDALPLENLLPTPGNIQWKLFVQFFELKQLRCDVLSPQELQQQAAACFDKCAIMQLSLRMSLNSHVLLLTPFKRRLQSLDTNDARAAQLVKESLELSQQGYHLQALADGDHSSSRSRSSRVPSSADATQEPWEALSTSTPRTRFYMTAFTREKTSVHPSASGSRDCSSQFSELKSESEHITEALAGKYKIRQKVRHQGTYASYRPSSSTIAYTFLGIMAGLHQVLSQADSPNH